jgi:hypothetical protein
LTALTVTAQVPGQGSGTGEQANADRYHKRGGHRKWLGFPYVGYSVDRDPDRIEIALETDVDPDPDFDFDFKKATFQQVDSLEAHSSCRYLDDR